MLLILTEYLRNIIPTHNSVTRGTNRRLLQITKSSGKRIKITLTFCAKRSALSPSMMIKEDSPPNVSINMSITSTSCDKQFTVTPIKHYNRNTNYQHVEIQFVSSDSDSDSEFNHFSRLSDNCFCHSVQGGHFTSRAPHVML